MAKNRYYADDPQDVFKGYEWLFREKLIELDHLSRELGTALKFARVPSNEVQPMIQQFFADMWEQVAETEEQRTRKGVTRCQRVK